jgi:hypothetical protein
MVADIIIYSWLPHGGVPLFQMTSSSFNNSMRAAEASSSSAWCARRGSSRNLAKQEPRESTPHESRLPRPRYAVAAAKRRHVPPAAAVTWSSYAANIEIPSGGMRAISTNVTLDGGTAAASFDSSNDTTEMV